MPACELCASQRRVWWGSEGVCHEKEVGQESARPAYLIASPAPAGRGERAQFLRVADSHDGGDGVNQVDMPPTQVFVTPFSAQVFQRSPADAQQAASKNAVHILAWQRNDRRGQADTHYCRTMTRVFQLVRPPTAPAL